MEPFSAAGCVDEEGDDPAGSVTARGGRVGTGCNEEDGTADSDGCQDEWKEYVAAPRAHDGIHEGVGRRQSPRRYALLSFVAFNSYSVLAQDIVNAHTEYAPLLGSEPLQYFQEVYTANLLSRTLKANKPIFEATPVTTNPSLPLPLPPRSNLKQLAELGIANTEASWPVFVALWRELIQPGRPPIMLAADGLSHIMRNSSYLSAHIKPIHAHDLTLVRHFVDCLSGKTALPNGGMVLAATSCSNSPASPALDLSIQIAEARQFHPEDMPRWNLYKHVDERVMKCLRDVEVLKIRGLSKEEARSIMEYYAESGMLRAKIDEGFVTEKWALAGMGNIGELERASVRLRV